MPVIPAKGFCGFTRPAAAFTTRHLPQPTKLLRRTWRRHGALPWSPTHPTPCWSPGLLPMHVVLPVLLASSFLTGHSAITNRMKFMIARGDWNAWNWFQLLKNRSTWWFFATLLYQRANLSAGVAAPWSSRCRAAKGAGSCCWVVHWCWCRSDRLNLCRKCKPSR